MYRLRKLSIFLTTVFLIILFVLPYLASTYSFAGGNPVSQFSEIYVSSFETGGDGSISVIQGTKLIDKINAGGEPCCKMAYDPKTSEIFVPDITGDNGYAQVLVISTISHKVVANISGFQEPIAAQFAPESGEIYVADQQASGVYVINATTNKVVDFITNRFRDKYPISLSYSPASHEIYVGMTTLDSGSWRFNVINPATNRVVEVLRLPAPNVVRSAYDPSNKDIFAATQFHKGSVRRTLNVVWIFNSRNQLIGNITGFLHCCSLYAPVPELAYNPVNQCMYLTDANQAVYLINNMNQIVARIIGFSTPTGIAYDSANQMIYVSNYGNGTVKMIYGTKVVGTISLGSSLQPTVIVLA